MPEKAKTFNSLSEERAEKRDIEDAKTERGIIYCNEIKIVYIKNLKRGNT